MYDKNQIVTELKKQLAIDFNCTPEDFDKKENVITVNKDNPGRRVYVPHKEFFSMVTLGSNAVISANESMHIVFIEGQQSLYNFMQATRGCEKEL